MAGGAGIYISSSLNALPRSDLNFDSDGQAESCWIEILHEHKPSIIVGCTYRHSSSNSREQYFAFYNTQHAFFKNYLFLTLFFRIYLDFGQKRFNAVCLSSV